uniref:Calponin-homology (CH) domain-containing protein n=1 Tax=Macaca fascicularis TaxID=9541 RepID=A0A7N9D3Q7_MACFA
MAQIPGEVDNMEGLPASNNNNLATRWESPDRGWEREQPAASTAAASLFECSRIKALADEREAVQKKTFTKWVNSHLARVGCHIGDLYVDLRDGFVLTRLLEVLSGEQLPRPTRGRMRIHSLENVDKALQFLKEQRVHLENVGSHDIVDGNHRLTLGLVWTIILRFQIQVIKIETEDNRETRSAKDALLLWCQMKTAGYPEVNIQNFTTSWRDGLAFNALIHRHRPDLVDFSKLTKSNANYNLQRAFRTAEQHLGLARLLDPEGKCRADPARTSSWGTPNPNAMSNSTPSHPSTIPNPEVSPNPNSLLSLLPFCLLFLLCDPSHIPSSHLFLSHPQPCPSSSFTFSSPTLSQTISSSQTPSPSHLYSILSSSYIQLQSIPILPYPTSFRPSPSPCLPLPRLHPHPQLLFHFQSIPNPIPDFNLSPNPGSALTPISHSESKLLPSSELYCLPNTWLGTLSELFTFIFTLTWLERIYQPCFI